MSITLTCIGEYMARQYEAVRPAVPPERSTQQRMDMGEHYVIERRINAAWDAAKWYVYDMDSDAIHPATAEQATRFEAAYQQQHAE